MEREINGLLHLARNWLLSLALFSRTPLRDAAATQLTH